MSGRSPPSSGRTMQRDREDRDQQRVVEGRERHVAVVAEQEEQPEDHEEVPLERHREREHRGDVEVEEDHPDDRDRPDRCRCPRVISRQRPEELLDGAEVGDGRGQPRRPHVLRVVAPEPALERAGPDQRRVADHRRDDEREVVVELRGRRPPPDEEEDELPGDDPVLDREEADDQDRRVDLRPGAEERDLVAQPEQPEQPEQHSDPRRRQLAGRAGDRVDAGGGQQEDPRGEHTRVQGDVEHGAGRPLRERDLVRPGRQPDRSGPQPVERAADRRARSGS